MKIVKTNTLRSEDLDLSHTDNMIRVVLDMTRNEYIEFCRKNKKEFEFDDFAETMKKAVQDGYITEKGYPLKCYNCDSKDLKFTQNYEDYIMEEESVKCNNCNSDVGLWSMIVWTMGV